MKNNDNDKNVTVYAISKVALSYFVINIKREKSYFNREQRLSNYNYVNKAVS